MTVYDYYTSSPYEFYAACEGYFDKLEDEAALQRIAAFRIHQSLVDKPLSLVDFWPLKRDQEQQEDKVKNLTKEEYTEWWDKMKHTHKFS